MLAPGRDTRRGAAVRLPGAGDAVHVPPGPGLRVVRPVVHPVRPDLPGLLGPGGGGWWQHIRLCNPAERPMQTQRATLGVLFRRRRLLSAVQLKVYQKIAVLVGVATPNPA